MNAKEKAKWDAVFAAAHEAGMKAGMAHAPNAMVVTGGVPGGPQQTWVVDEGVCGFAWVVISDGRSALAQYAKEAHGYDKFWGKGIYFWVGEFNQSYERKMKYAEAYAAVLKENGVNAYHGGRLD